MSDSLLVTAARSRRLRAWSPDLFEEIIRPEDIDYTHPVFLQCILPTRHTEKNRDRWQTESAAGSLHCDCNLIGGRGVRRLNL
jgi:hypothetical protein